MKMLEWKLNTIIRLNISKDFWMLTPFTYLFYIDTDTFRTFIQQPFLVYIEYGLLNISSFV